MSAWAGTCPLVTSKWDLWQSGQCLRGANTWQKIVEPGDDKNVLGGGRVGPPFSLETFIEARSWGANVINLSFPGLYTEKAPHTLDHEAQKHLDDILEKLRQAKLYAVISFRTGPGRSEKSFSNATSTTANRVWKNKAAQDAWVAMWQMTASRYRNHPAVIGYHLMVEPNGNMMAPNGWDAKTFFKKYGKSLYNWHPLAQRISNAIRSVDNETPILISAMNWGDPLWLEYLPVSYNKTVYVVHQWEPGLYTHQYPPFEHTYPGYFDGNYDGEPDTIDKTYLEKILKPVVDFKSRYGVPVAVMEYGVMRWEPEAATLMRDQYSLFESYSLNHAIWLWETDFRGVDWDDFNFRAGNQPELVQQIKSNWKHNSQFMK